MKYIFKLLLITVCTVLISCSSQSKSRSEDGVISWVVCDEYRISKELRGVVADCYRSEDDSLPQYKLYQQWSDKQSITRAELSELKKSAPHEKERIRELEKLISQGAVEYQQTYHDILNYQPKFYRMVARILTREYALKNGYDLIVNQRLIYNRKRSQTLFSPESGVIDITNDLQSYIENAVVEKRLPSINEVRTEMSEYEELRMTPVKGRDYVTYIPETCR